MDASRRAAAKGLTRLAAVLLAAAPLLAAGAVAGAADLGESPVHGVRLPAAPMAGPAQVPAAPEASGVPSLSVPSTALPPALPTAGPIPASAVVTPHLNASPAVQLQARLTAGSPSADPRAAEAPRPAGVSAGLQTLARSLGQEQEQQPTAQAQPAPSAAARAFFDGGLGKAVKTGAILASAAVPGGAAMPAAYALARYTGERAKRPAPEPAPLRRRLAERAESHLALLAMAFPAVIAHGFVSNGIALTLIAALLAYGGAAGMQELLAQSRNRVVGGWQASHDQRYRVDPNTGLLKDVRGHKYGEDRYDERAPGPVGPGERLWMRLVSAGAGALLLSAWSGTSALLYGAALTAGWLAADLLADRRPAAERAYSAEERAHAERFRH